MPGGERVSYGTGTGRDGETVRAVDDDIILLTMETGPFLLRVRGLVGVGGFGTYPLAVWRSAGEESET